MLFFQTGVPLYSKNVFNHFPFPILYTTIVESGVAFVLTLFNLGKATFQTFVLKKERAGFMCDRFFFRKLMLMLLTGIAFGIGNILSNTGLAGGTVLMHVLFRSSEIGWVVVFSAIMLFDFPTIPILYACAVLLVGCVLTSLDYSQIAVHNTAFFETFFGNFTSAFLLGFQYVTLRSFWTILKEQHSPEQEDSKGDGIELNVLATESRENTSLVDGGTNDNSANSSSIVSHQDDKIEMDILEALQFKMYIAAVAFPFAAYYQYEAWSSFDITVFYYLIGSCFFTLGLHGSIVALSSVATATTVGFVAQVPIALQFVISVVISGKNPDWRQWLGTGMIFIGAMLYSSYKLMKTEKDVRKAPLVRFMKWLESLAFCWRK